MDCLYAHTEITGASRHELIPLSTSNSIYPGLPPHYVNTPRHTAIAFRRRGIAGSKLAVLTTFTLLDVLLRITLGDGQDRDLRLRISCRLRILRPALVAVVTKQLVATTDAESHGHRG
jgi:hypothetical protein